MDDASPKPWYHDGLSFTCTRCGNCCGGGPGYVWADEAEIRALAARLELSVTEFRRRYTRFENGRTSLAEKRNYDCIFYDRQSGCTVYEDRPLQCRTWPFWGKVVATPRTWEIESEDCPGMNQGRRWSAEEIRELAEDDGLPDE